MPLTPPDGFCKAVSLPILTMSLMELGTAPLATSSNTTKSDCVSRGLSRRTRRCSIVIPEGPLAAPRLPDLTLRLNRSLSNWNSTSGTWPRMSSCNGSRGVASLARNKRNVFALPGANSALCNTCLADENAPKRTNWSARSARLTFPSCPCLLERRHVIFNAFSSFTTQLRINSIQWPEENLSKR